MERLKRGPKFGTVKGNPIKIFKTRAQIYKNSNRDCFFLVDIDDLPIVKNKTWTWCKTNRPQAHVRGYPHNSITIHRLISACPENMVVDHIDGNKLNNRKQNLRICTAQQNKLNSTLFRKNKNGNLMSGVTMKRKRFSAAITVDGTVMRLGVYKTKEEAESAVIVARQKYFGLFSPHISRNK